MIKVPINPISKLSMKGDKQPIILFIIGHIYGLHRDVKYMKRSAWKDDKVNCKLDGSFYHSQKPHDLYSYFAGSCAAFECVIRIQHAIHN